MAPGEGVLDRIRLMRVELRDAARFEGAAQPRIEDGRKRDELRRNCREPPHGGDVVIGRIGPLPLEASESFEGGVERTVAAGTCCQPSRLRSRSIGHDGRS
jgi:hypothetical protein